MYAKTANSVFGQVNPISSEGVNLPASRFASIYRTDASKHLKPNTKEQYTFTLFLLINCSIK